MKGYERDPRSLAKRAEAYLKSTGIADTAYFGPENEFFIFDDVRWGANMAGSFCKVDSDEGMPGTPSASSRTATSVTARPSRRLLPRPAGRLAAKTSAPPCAWHWKRWAW